MRFPKFLQEKGRIGHIAPSFGPTIEPYDVLFAETLNRFNREGYTNVVGFNCFASNGIGKSNTAKACGEEINRFFTEDNCDIVLSAGGGETMCEDLEFVDFEALKKAEPKWFMGYSDNTNLIYTLTTICDTAAVYGPNACEFAQNPPHEAVNDAWNLLTGKNLTVHNYPAWEPEGAESEDIFAPYRCTEPNRFRIYLPDGKGNLFVNFPVPKEEPPVRFKGRLIGGCLDVLSVLCGTKYDHTKEFIEKYKGDGIVWFFEACDLGPMDLRRAVWQLSQAGWFEGASGFLIGRSRRIGESAMGMNMYNAVTGVLNRYEVPVLMDLDIGHLPPMMPLVSGALCEVSAKPGNLTVEQILR